MPTAALRPCRPGCPSKIGNGRTCPAHPPRAAWRNQGFSRGAEHKAHRRRLWKGGPPPCVECLAPAVALDHDVPLSKGGLDTEDNRVPLCKLHHDAKTARESRR